MGEHTFDLKTEKQLGNLMTPGGGPAVIDFWAGWCGPCRAMAPIYDEVAERYADTEVGFYKLDTENDKAIARTFNVRSIPTIMLIDDGQIVDVVVGRINGKRLGRKVDWLISKSRGESALTRLMGKLKGA
jgi:thioredoxin 1